MISLSQDHPDRILQKTSDLKCTVRYNSVLPFVLFHIPDVSYSYWVRSFAKTGVTLVQDQIPKRQNQGEEMNTVMLAKCSKHIQHTHTQIVNQKQMEAGVLFQNLLPTERTLQKAQFISSPFIKEICLYLNRSFIQILHFLPNRLLNSVLLQNQTTGVFVRLWGTSARLWGEFGFHPLKVIRGGRCFSGLLPLPPNLAAEGWTTQLSVLWGNHLPHQLHHSTMRKSFISNLHPSLLTKEWKPKHACKSKNTIKSIRYDMLCGWRELVKIQLWTSCSFVFPLRNGRTKGVLLLANDRMHLIRKLIHFFPPEYNIDFFF